MSCKDAVRPPPPSTLPDPTGIPIYLIHWVAARPPPLSRLATCMATFAPNSHKHSPPSHVSNSIRPLKIGSEKHSVRKASIPRGFGEACGRSALNRRDSFKQRPALASGATRFDRAHPGALVFQSAPRSLERGDRGLVLVLCRNGFLGVDREPVEICIGRPRGFMGISIANSGQLRLREHPDLNPALEVRGLLVIKSVAR